MAIDDHRLTDSGDDADLEQTSQVTSDSGRCQFGDVGRTDGRLDTDTESLIVCCIIHDQ